jgi:hypothetical protein
VRLGRAAKGERLGGFIYGTILVLAVVVAGSKAYPHSAGNIAVLVVVTAIVFWVAHVYAHVLGHSVADDRHLSYASLRAVARREWSLVEAAVPPAVALSLGALGVISTQTAVWAALALGLIVLAAEGVVVARIERLGWLGTAGVVAANVALGLVIVGLKLLVGH